MKKEKNIFIEEYISCSCGQDGLLLTSFGEEDEGDDFISVCITGPHYITTLKEKLRVFFRILKYGTPYRDEILLDRQGLEKLILFCKAASIHRLANSPIKRINSKEFLKDE